MYTRYHGDPELVALVPKEHRKHFKKSAQAPPEVPSNATHEDSRPENDNDSDDDTSAPESNKPLSGALSRSTGEPPLGSPPDSAHCFVISGWTYTPQEIDTIKSIIIAEREQPGFNPYIESWWEKFKSQVCLFTMLEWRTT